MPPRKDKKLSLDDPSAWDDSSLVQAWEQVFEDYKDMQNQEEKQESQSNEKEKNTGKKRRKIASTKKEQSFEAAEEEAAEEVTLAEIGEECFTQAQAEEPKQDSTFAVPVEPQINLPTGFPGLEDGNFPSLPFYASDVNPSLTEKDENLSNMMMAWYYAGYYTGVYQANKKRKRL